jgi:proteasome lid subunit RPN8/RPN11
MSTFSITAEEAAAIRAHAVRDFPREACGVLAPNGYVPLPNRHPEPEKAFDCSADAAEFQIAGRLRAVVHSHVDRNPGPSAEDMIQQMAMAVPWGIVLTDGETAAQPWFWGDMLDPPPLIGRKFRHGPSGTDGRGDCYALIRDFYRMELRINLVEGPRDDDWWKHGKNLYLDNFERAGFIVSPDGARAPQRGDVMLLHEAGDVPHHAGVYDGQGRFWHHLANRLSRREPTAAYLQSHAVTKWLRYVGSNPR